MAALVANTNVPQVIDDDDDKDDAVKLKASKELFEKRIKEMDLTAKEDFKEGDKFGYLCDDGVLIECDVLRKHSKDKKVFVHLGQSHSHLTDKHSCWMELPNTRICSIDKMTQVQLTIARQQSTDPNAAVDDRVKAAVGGGSNAGPILDALTKQPSVLNQIEKMEIDVDARNALKVTDKVKVYSDSQKKWFDGEIIKVWKDNEGEWLKIKYEADNVSKEKDVQRLSEYLKLIQ